MNYENWPRLLVVDVEGNGATPPDLVEVAILPLRAGTPDTSTAGAWLIRPPTAVTPFATRIHKLTNDELATCPPGRPSVLTYGPRCTAHGSAPTMPASNTRC